MAHNCPDCEKPCYCDEEDAFNEGEDDCIHYLSASCTWDEFNFDDDDED